jgi:UDPglucose 6-dehydrogenase
MNKIGIIGQGFVGNAIYQSMNSVFDVFTYDLKTGLRINGRFISPLDYGSKDVNDRIGLAYQYIADNVDGPVFICLPTPMGVGGQCNAAILEDAIVRLSKCKLSKLFTLIIKSTIPPGTTEEFSKKYPNINFCFNPEFLTARTAVEDFADQTYTIIGADNLFSGDIVEDMYHGWNPHLDIIHTGTKTAEMVKYVRNCFYAVKLSYANEIYQICQKIGLDYDEVIEYTKLSPWAGKQHWSVPGHDGKIGYSGKCIPKDINAFIFFAEQLGIDPKTMKGSWEKNLELRPEKNWE